MTFREQWNDERLRYHDDTNGNNDNNLLNKLLINCLMSNHNESMEVSLLSQ